MYKCFKINKTALLIPAAVCAALLLAAHPKAVQTAADTENNQKSVSLTAVMYHSVLKDTERTGEYVITPDELEKDLANFRQRGMNTVTPQMLTDFTDGKSELPENPLLITFDDGHLNNLTYALPLLEKYDMTAIVNVIGSYTVKAEEENDPNPYYACLTHDDIKLLAQSGRFDIGCHTYDMHGTRDRMGSSKNSWETSDEYKAAFSDDLDKFSREISEKCGINTIVYAYPYGYTSPEGYDLLIERGYRIILTCRERNNVLCFGSAQELIVIDRYNRSGLLESDAFMKKIGI